MMVAMAGLQVFIVRFFFQVCYPSCPVLRGHVLINPRAQERVTCKGAYVGSFGTLGRNSIMGFKTFYVVL